MKVQFSEYDFIKMDVDELFETLGASVITSEGPQSKNKSKYDLQYIGKEFFNNSKELIKLHICSDELRNNINKSDNVVNLVSIIADALATQFQGLPLLSISWLIVKIGIENFCSNKQ